MCEATRNRVIESGGSMYRTELTCTETGPHHEMHYDATYHQEWSENEAEPEMAVATKTQAYFGFYHGMGIPA